MEGSSTRLYNSAAMARECWELDNNITTTLDLNSLNNEHQKEKPWTNDPRYFKRVKVSNLALLKMAMHASGDRNVQPVGILRGKTDGDAVVVVDVFPLPTQPAHSRVHAHSMLLHYCHSQLQAGRSEDVVGWYHSHPADISTQMGIQHIQEPSVALVLDPSTTLCLGKVKIDAFRMYPESYDPVSEYQTATPDTIVDFRTHLSKCYSLEITFFKNSQERDVLEELWDQYWRHLDLAAKLDQSREQLSQTNDEAIVKLCTSESYDFVNVPFEVDRGNCFLDVTVGVIDGCRKMSEYCEKDELTFLGDLSGLADYKAVSNLCLNCCQNGIDKEVAVGISAHGYFCAAIIASRNIANVEVGGISLGTVRGVSPPPRIALYAVGCPSCLKMTEDNMSEGIRAAIQQKVKVISMSLAREFPAHYYEDSPNFHERDSATLTALNADILTIVSAGNLGEYGLRTVAKTAPWCLTVASCTPRRKFHTVLSFHLPLSKPKTFDIEVESMNIMECDWTVLRNNGKISGSQCLLFYDGKANHVVIEASKTVTEAPSLIPVVSIPVKDSLIIAEALAQAHTENKEEDLYVKITCSVKKDVINSPLVSTFSGRGPCSFFQEFMKPEICAPGEEIAAAWPTSEPLGGFGPPTYSDFNVKRGTSFATPIVAAAVATLRAENKFSATASYSAIITSAVFSAKKMHGKERVAYEFAYGAGMLDLKRAMRPGLVYEESTERYQRWFSGGMSHLELNLPYFSATFPAGDSPWNCEFKRKVKSVEIGKCTYVAKVVVHKLSLQCASVSIKTTSNRLIFEEQGEEQEFSLLVRLPRTREKKDTFGLISASLIWQNEENEELVVVSPIILSSKNVPGPHITDELYKQLVDILVAIFCSTNYSIMS